MPSFCSWVCSSGTSVPASFFSRLFAKREPKPIREQPADLIRRLFLRCENLELLIIAIAEYQEVSRQDQEHTLAVVQYQEWIVVEMPSSIHSCYPLCLGTWFPKETRRMVSFWSSDAHWEFVVIPDPGDEMYWIGVNEAEIPISISVPMLHTIRGESIEIPASTASGLLAALSVPPSLVRAPLEELGDVVLVPCTSEDFGTGYNRGLETTHARRPSGHDYSY